MKKKTFGILLVMLVVLPLTLLLAACGSSATHKDDDLDTGNVVPKHYTISYETGIEGVKIDPQTAPAGTEIVPPTTNLVREGYYFQGWEYEGEPFAFDTMPEKDLTLVAKWFELTNLPTMMIDLFDAAGNVVPLNSVTRESYVDSAITITNTEKDFELYSLKSEFKGRGNGSWAADKKSYKIKFDKKQSLFGRQSNKHWVIVACANFDDSTMSRNYLAYNLAGELFSGIEYVTSAEWLDVYVNGEYCGVYLLCEHVRVDKKRVDIKSEYGVEDTGYLIEYDAYYSGEENIDYFKADGLNLKYAFTIHSPDPEDGEYETKGGISKEQFRQQVLYIKDYVTRVYRAALEQDFETFAALVDVDSFVDMYLLHELFKNTDTGYSSFYLYKKPGGKLYAGPVWDFDGTTTAAYGDNSPEGIYVAESILTHSNFTASELYISLYKTLGFQTKLTARWNELSPLIGNFLDQKLNDAVYEANRVAMGKNFALWKGQTQAAAEIAWINDVKALKQWLLDRIEWLNNTWAIG